MRCKSVVEIAPQSQIQRPISLRDRILDIKRQFFDVGVSIKGEEAARGGIGQPSSADGAGRVRSKQPSKGLKLCS